MRIAPRTSLAVLLLAAVTADAQWYQGSFWQGGAQVTTLTVLPGQTFSLEAHAFMVGSNELWGYELYVDAPPSMLFSGWSDPRGWDAYVGEYPLIFAGADQWPLYLNPGGTNVHLGTSTFQAPSASGNYLLTFGAGSALYDDYFEPRTGPWTPVNVIVGSGGGPEPDAPPVPPDYDMGPLVNGDFEAGGGSLSGWSSQAYWPSRTDIYTASGSTDHVARAHAEGSWQLMPGPFPGMDEWVYYSESSSIQQSVLIPLDATGLSFTYTTREIVELSGTPTAGVQIGSSSQSVPGTVDWLRTTVPIPSAAKGRRVAVSFYANDGGSGWETWPPATRNVMDLYVDYVAIDGTLSAQTTTWATPGGGSWEQVGNWSPAQVPENSTTVVHDVVIPASIAGPGQITVGVPHIVQTIRDERRGDALVLQPGASLHAVEDAWFKGAAVHVAAGSTLEVEEDMSFEGGTLSVHPDGDPAGGTALTVGGTLLFDDDPADSTAATVTVRDAVIEAGNLTIGKANVGLVNSSGSTVQSAVSVTGNTYLSYGLSGVLTLAPGTTLATRALSISSGASVNVAGAAIIGQGSNPSISNSGTLAFSGPNCQVTGLSISNYSGGKLLCTNATTTFGGNVSSYGTITLIDSAVTVDGVFSLSGRVAADGGSSITFKKALTNTISAAADCALTEAEVRYAGATLSQMDVPGLNVGPFTHSFANNFGIGSLVVASGTLQLCQSGSGHALYVRHLLIEPGATLDLNGVALYYLSDVTVHGTLVGGEALKAYVRPPGLPEVVLAPDFVARAEACGVVQEMTGAGAQASGSYGPNSSANSLVAVGSGAGYRTVTVDLDGSTWWDPWLPPPGPVDAEGSLTGGLQLAATPQYPAGRPVKVKVRAALRGYAGYGVLWSCEVFRETQLLATLNASHPEEELLLMTEEPGLHIQVAVSDDGDYFDDLLQIMLYAIPTSSNADFSGDDDVDGDDYATLLNCTTGAGIPYAAPPQGCPLNLDGEGVMAADFDRDLDVDADDFAVFQRCYSGPGGFADVSCEW